MRSSQPRRTTFLPYGRPLSLMTSFWMTLTPWIRVAFSEMMIRVSLKTSQYQISRVLQCQSLYTVRMDRCKDSLLWVKAKAKTSRRRRGLMIGIDLPLQLSRRRDSHIRHKPRKYLTSLSIRERLRPLLLSSLACSVIRSRELRKLLSLNALPDCNLLEALWTSREQAIRHHMTYLWISCNPGGGLRHR